MLNKVMFPNVLEKVFSCWQIVRMMFCPTLITFCLFTPVKGHSAVSVDSKTVLFKSKQMAPTCYVTAPDIWDLGEITTGVEQSTAKIEHITIKKSFELTFTCNSLSGAAGKTYWVYVSSPGTPWATGATFVKMASGAGTSSDLSLYLGLITSDQNPVTNMQYGFVYDNDVKRYMARIHSAVDTSISSKYGMCGVNGGGNFSCYFTPVIKLVRDSSKLNSLRSQSLVHSKNSDTYEQIITFSVVYL